MQREKIDGARSIRVRAVAYMFKKSQFKHLNFKFKLDKFIH